jgi:hypothetical protein
MSLNTLFLDADGAASSKKSWKSVGYFLFASMAALMFVAIISNGANNFKPEAVNAIGYPTARLGQPRANARSALTGFQPQFSRATVENRVAQDMISSIGSSPMAKLAISAVKANNQFRDISLKAAEETKSELSSMDDATKQEVEEMTKTVALKAQDMAGVTGPLGFFDPLGFATDTPAGKLLFYREVELKHGRICMLAALGFLVGENFHPLFGGNIDVPSYLAFQQTPLQTFWPAVVFAIAIPELYSVFTFKEPDTGGNFWMIKEDHVPGDLGFDPLGLKPTDPAEFKELQTKELNNGRLAMIAAAGMIAQELATGQKLF